MCNNWTFDRRHQCSCTITQAQNCVCIRHICSNVYRIKWNEIEFGSAPSSRRDRMSLTEANECVMHAANTNTLTHTSTRICTQHQGQTYPSELWKSSTLVIIWLAIIRLLATLLVMALGWSFTAIIYHSRFHCFIQIDWRRSAKWFFNKTTKKIQREQLVMTMRWEKHKNHTECNPIVLVVGFRCGCCCWPSSAYLYVSFLFAHTNGTLKTK